MTEKEIIDRMEYYCDTEDECKQKKFFTNDYFTFIAHGGIFVDDDYLDCQEYKQNANISLIRESDEVMFGKKNHLCKFDADEEVFDSFHNMNIKSSFMIINEELKDFDSN